MLRSPADLHHLRRLVPQNNLARPPAGLYPDQVDRSQGIEFPQPLEEGRVTDLRLTLPPGIDRAGDQRFGLLLRQLSDPPEQQPLVCGESPNTVGKVDVLRLLICDRDVLLDDFGAGGALGVQHRPLHQVQPHPHIARLHRLLNDAVQYRCREYTRIEPDPDPLLKDAPDLLSIVGREV